MYNFKWKVFQDFQELKSDKIPVIMTAGHEKCEKDFAFKM